MTKQSPRIYVYKIIFLEIPHYYFGSHKEKYFNEFYLGSPVTNKDVWVFYTPIKEIIKEFPFTDEGYIEARNYEDSLIEPVYKTDPFCLNEACKGRMTINSCRRGGQKTGKYHYENGTGIFSLTTEEKREVSRKNGQTHYENGTGIFSITPEEKREISRRVGQTHYEMGLVFFL
jgi:hypothetical protein